MRAKDFSVKHQPPNALAKHTYRAGREQVHSRQKEIEREKMRGEKERQSERETKRQRQRDRERETKRQREAGESNGGKRAPVGVTK